MSRGHDAMLDHLEHRSYRMSVDHGLIDLMIGAFLIAIGLMLHADLDYMPAVVFFIGALAYPRARHRLVEPRIGHVRLRADRIARLSGWKWLTLLALVLAVFGVLVLRGVGWLDYPESARPLVVSACLSGPLALAAWLFGIRRGFLYAVIVLVGGVMEWRFGLAYGSSWYFSGGLVCVAGLALLLRFTRQHPTDNGGSHGA